jgi:hypothetical protein
MKERDPYHEIARLGREAIELQAEFSGALDDHDRRVALIQLRALDAERKRSTDQIEAFEQLPAVWETIYGAGDGYIALFTGVRQHRRLVAPHEGYFTYPDHIDQAQQWVRQAAASDREIYMCGHLTTERRRRKATAAPLWSLYADIDAAPTQSAAVPPPSLMVESSPGRFHAYWRLSEPVAPAIGEALNRQLAVTLGADKTGWDTTQLLRAPGGLNHKYPEAPVVRVVAHRGDWYRPDELVNPHATLPLFGQRPEPKPRPMQPTAPPSAIEALPLTATARRILQGEVVTRRPDGEIDRSASLLHMARILAGAGLDAAAIATILAERDAAFGWRKYSDRTDAYEQYARIAAIVTR